MQHTYDIMFGNFLLFVVSWITTAFLSNRLYVIIRYREITIKGVTYSKSSTPIMYWLQMLLIIAGLLMTGGIAVVITLGSLGLFD